MVFALWCVVLHCGQYRSFSDLTLPTNVVCPLLASLLPLSRPHKQLTFCNAAEMQ